MHFRASDGAKIAYRIIGTGQPLLCLAGLTRNATDFDYLEPHLPGVQMICMDYRGRGASDWTGAETYIIPREATDVIELLDHLKIDRIPILGTSRGGIVAMGLAVMARDRMAGVCFNDIGPVIDMGGLDRIKDYVGHNPAAKSFEACAKALKANSPGFDKVPDSRWMEEVTKHYVATDEGLLINYDPALKESFLAAYKAATPDLWPFFDALTGDPVALVRGANSDLLSRQTVTEMQARRPDMVFANVPDRAHIPYLDEPEAVGVVRKFLELCA
jgi:pimeloyl-ACP methyl ester carboxylesterase